MKAAVLYDTTSHNLNLLHWGHLEAHDPFFAIKIRNRTIVFVSELEFGRFRSQSTFQEVHLWSEFRKGSSSNAPFWPPFFRFLQKQYAIDQFLLPNDFPASIYAEIVSVVPVAFDAAFFETQRAIKTVREVGEIRKACTIAAKILQKTIEKIRNSTVKDGILYHEGKVLTSERLQGEMEVDALQQGCCAQGTIVAGGADAVDPHNPGSGVLREKQFIVIDFFPCLQSSHYYGDRTRTVFKGKPTEEQVRMYRAVQECQQLLIQRIRPGVYASELMSFALKFFEQQGYARKQTPNGCEGLIHSVGHGIGLDLHEYPSIGSQPIRLEPGMVVAIEPGLYFPSLGGVRMEDDVWITETGCEVLSPCELGGFFP